MAPDVEVAPDAPVAPVSPVRPEAPVAPVDPVTSEMFLSASSAPGGFGNFDPAESLRFLHQAYQAAQGGALLIGVDLVKDPATLVAAYDDSRGVTAAFNLNLLVRANAGLDADFDLDAFAHRAVWNPDQSRMEMHLQALRQTAAHVGDRAFTFMVGETLHTESSRKFTRDSVEAMARESGWSMAGFEVSPEPRVALALLRG